jgi:penicillin-binding protein 2
MKNKSVLYTYLIIIILFVLLLIRYLYLQVYVHKTLLKQSIGNYLVSVVDNPIRGVITDKNGILLVNNKIEYKAVILAHDAKEDPDQIDLATQYISLSQQDKNKYYKQIKNASNNEWIIIKDILNSQEIANLTAHNLDFPSIKILIQAKRDYLYSDLYAHSIGYVSKINRHKQLQADQIYKDNYNNLDLIGISGIENFYEKYLRGKPGVHTVQVDAYGDAIKNLGDIARVDGNSLELTLDHQLQMLGDKLLANRKGAIVALNPKNGAVLSFISKPGYNPNEFIEGITTTRWQELSKDPTHPLLNRVTQGLYPPGSIFKPFLAVACLYYKVCHENDSMFDNGYFQLSGSSHKFRESHQKGLGHINFRQAIAYSSDVYFYDLGYKLGIDKATALLTIFGFGKKTGIDLPLENNGILPSKRWKEKRFIKNKQQKNWLAADTVSFSIGQGFNAYTPMQMAYTVTILANRGLVVKPHLLNRIIDKTGQEVYRYKPYYTLLAVPKGYFDFVDSAMVDVTKYGTARNIFSNLPYNVAAKTGTAQVVAMKSGSRENVRAGAQFKDHAWLVAFAPAEDPKIVIVVLVENGGFGASAAGPIARQMIEYYMNKEQHDKENNISQS